MDQKKIIQLQDDFRRVKDKLETVGMILPINKIDNMEFEFNEIERLLYIILYKTKNLYK